MGNVASIDAPGALTADRRPTIPRLPFVEGLRGIAALVVFLGHALHVDNGIFLSGYRSVFSADGRSLAAWTVWPGREMVLLFLTVSAFSLAYSERVRRARGNPPTRLRQFALRRAWRVAPTYYVALALGAVAVAVVPATFARPRIEFAPVVDVTPAGVVAHLLFLHDLRGGWADQVNGPLWSMACEVQLYALFPLLFWAARRWNAWLVCVPLFVVAEVAAAVHPWDLFTLAGFFALGLLAAEVYPRVTDQRARWLAVGGGVALVVAMLNVVRESVAHDVLWAAAILSLLLAMTRWPESRRNPCNGRWLRTIGLRSYSLYALHFPVVMVVAYLARSVGGQPWTVLLISAPFVALVVELGYRLVEKPSMRRSSAVGRQ
jgi:peptidoglycan/LPS O-acetylase OafA/YrhL